MLGMRIKIGFAVSAIEKSRKEKNTIVLGDSM
jgi:hypothetical protein